MDALDIIVRTESAAATWTLYGRHTPRGWSFHADLDDNTLTPVLPKHVHQVSDEVSSWDDALSLFDRQPWYRFRPVRVHAQFRDAVWHAFQQRMQRYGSTPELEASWQAMVGGEG